MFGYIKIICIFAHAKRTTGEVGEWLKPTVS